MHNPSPGLALALICLVAMAPVGAAAKEKKDHPVRKNVLGEPLRSCCCKTVGFYRDGFCRVGPEDAGRHAVCSEVTEEFLAFTKSEGNDLSTPNAASGFPGLKPGERWCLCVSRWLSAHKAGHAPPVDLAATDEDALRTLSLEVLKANALSAP